MFEPTTTDRWALPSGRVVDVLVAHPTFARWRGDPITHSYGNKALCDLDATPAFAELVIVDAFHRDDWDAVWVDSYRRRYWEAMPTASDPIALPDAPAQLLAQLTKETGTRSGTWDVLAWKRDSFRFVEAKRTGKDRIQPAQRAFLDAGLNAGQPLGAFLLVSWDLA